MQKISYSIKNNLVLSEEKVSILRRKERFLLAESHALFNSVAVLMLENNLFIRHVKWVGKELKYITDSKAVPSISNETQHTKENIR